MSTPGAFFTLSSDLMVRLDSDARILQLNLRWLDLLSRSPRDHVGALFTELVAPEQRRPFMLEWSRIREIGNDKGIETELLDGSGAAVPARVRCHRAGEEYHLVAYPAREDMIAQPQDITLRAEWDGLISSLEDTVLSIDKKLVIRTIYRPPEGFPIDQMLGQSLLFFVPEANREELRERWQRVLNEGETIRYETQFDYPHGTMTFVTRGAPMIERGEITGALVVTRDVSLQRQAEVAKRAAEAQLRAYTKKLEDSNRELERFASVASHDLQEPLRKSRAFSDRIKTKYAETLPERGQDYFERIQNAAGRMAELINDLLTFSRLKSSPRQPIEIDLNELAAQVLSDLEVRITETGAKIELGQLPAIYADPTQAGQLLQNLVGNALKFTKPNEPPIVEITAGDAPERPGWIELCVRDHGIGIDPKYHARVFGIFERLHGRGRYKGTGIGLAICKRIVEQNGGMLRLESEAGEGCTFIIELPGPPGRLEASAS